MQMAKGCVKNEKKIEILGRWRTILALEFKRKKTVDYDFIHSRHCLVWHGSKKIWVVCTLGYEVSHLSLSSSKVVTGELHSCMRNPGQLSPDLKGWSFAKWWGGCWVTQLNTKLNPHIFKHLKNKTLDLVLWTKDRPNSCCSSQIEY